MWVFYSLGSFLENFTVPSIQGMQINILPGVTQERTLEINTHNAEIFLYKPWRPKFFFQFEIIVNVSATSFCFI